MGPSSQALPPPPLARSRYSLAGAGEAAEGYLKLCRRWPAVLSGAEAVGAHWFESHSPSPAVEMSKYVMPSERAVLLTTLVMMLTPEGT